MYWGNESKKSDNERYLEEQLEREREANERRRRDEDAAREQRLAEMRQRSEDSLREAASWPAALRNQIILAGREATLEAQDAERYPDMKHDFWFTEIVSACERALAIWPVEANKVQAEIDDLQAQIEELRLQLRERVGKRLERVGKRIAPEKGYHLTGWREVADTLQHRDASPAAWLDW